MRFNSLPFLAFLALVVPCVHRLPHRVQNVLLVAVSYLFYGWWDWRFCSLLLLSTVVDFIAAKRIAASDDRRIRTIALATSLCVNLGVLGLFKYHGFFLDTFTLAMGALGFEVHASTWGLLLPVGISFYTLQTLAYTIDVYRGTTRPTSDPVAFALYVSFFPQLVAGPIERAAHLLPQLESPRTLTPHFVRTGITLLVIGWFKKVGIADGVAPLVDEIYADPGSFSAVTLIGAQVLFAIQIYCDFSGYSDMARGSARLLGVDLRVNFAQPYLSQTASELWRRWHISLSSWFIDYVYIPLGGSQGSVMRSAATLMAVFVISGLWHGASWTFILFGVCCGTTVLVHRAWRSLAFNRGLRVARTSPRGLLGIALTFTGFVAPLVFFRSAGGAQAWTVCAGIVSNPWTTGPEWVYWVPIAVYGLPMLLLDAWQLQAGEEEPMLSLGTPAKGAMLGAATVWVLIMGGVDASIPFAYFQF